jgi:hypothetical protein
MAAKRHRLAQRRKMMGLSQEALAGVLARTLSALPPAGSQMPGQRTCD